MDTDLSDGEAPRTAPMALPPRRQPNILITGTPGTGKTTTASLLTVACPSLTHVEVGALVKKQELHTGFDSEFNSYIINEDAVIDELEMAMSSTEGGMVVDHHGSDFFPERWFDLVVVLRTRNEILWQRLEKRGYDVKKIQENIECEIMQVVLEEARESYRPEIVWELESEGVEQMEENVQKIVDWVEDFVSRHEA
ncbi:AAA domain-containing protein [Gaertneriomyces semiglobifer]|nr:AAA domain-containing protein [Gaertneriomyces semiglobifer]